jgi:hypothetical protein
MKRLSLTAVLIMSIVVGTNAQEFPRADGIQPAHGLFGMGLIVGEPTGISAKYWLGSDRAVDFALGASFFTDFRAHVTYLYHVDVFDNQRVPLYYGIGGSIAGRTGRIAEFGSDTRRDRVGLGVRGAVGVSYLVPTAPFDLFIEFGSVLIVFPPAALDIDLSIGMRYYF